MSYLVLLLSTLLILSRGFNIKTRQLCCGLGINYSLNGQDCKTFQPPIAGVPTEDERSCLNTVDFCCKKELRTRQCSLGKEDALSGTCSEEEGDRRDCCDACRMGIESKTSDGLCIDALSLGSPYSETFTSCCKETVSRQEPLSTKITPKPSPKAESTVSAGSTKYSKLEYDLPFLPGLSEENVCETGEFCAQLCETTGKSFKCSCFPGYQLMKDGVSCKPIKRAKGSRCEQNNPCDHDCTDTGISIECSCREGFELAPDKKTCKDIDECALGVHECEPTEECENDDGTYFCFDTELEPDEISSRCPSGHRFNAEKSLCVDVDECEIPLICPPPKVCRNLIGSFICEGPDCPPGFYFKASIEICADIDECVTGANDCNKDSQICVNTKGNYTCIDKASRKACPPGFKKNGTTLQCKDVDECEDKIRVCSRNEECVNEEGGYKCLKLNSVTNELGNHIPVSIPVTTPRLSTPPSCPKGFKYNVTQNTCDDINECQLRLDNCSAMHRCDNTIGSFYCTRTVSCGTGYTLNSASDLCEDDDECALGTHTCYELGSNYKCKNQMGTYRCEPIRPMYRASTSSTTLSTEKTSIATTASITYTSTSKSPSGSMSTGTTNGNSASTFISTTITNFRSELFYGGNRKPWWLQNLPAEKSVTRPTYTTQITTRPITEKTYPKPYSSYSRSHFDPLSIPPRKTTTLPIINGMLKKCLPGYRMDPKGDCEDIDECESNPCPRGSKCLNFNGRFQCTSPLHCKIGYEPNDAGDECIDVDECASGIHNCSDTQTCKNGQGYYTCECPQGHHLNRYTQVCEDLDECKFYRPCGNYAECTNTVGSYQCSCKDGFKMNQNYCDDINECQDFPGLCRDICINSWGSYRCACKPGFVLNADNRTCTDINECEKFKDSKLCIGTCVNTPGSYTCECPRGYKLGSDKRVCVDIDECQHNVCAPQDACVNTRGGYKCYPITCSSNYVKDPNHKARCKRLTCDARDNQCLLMPEQYSYQFMALVSNLPLSEDGIPLFKIKGPDWTSANADFSIKLLDVNSPPGVKRVNESYIRKILHENNLMELSLVKSIQGPQEVKLQVEMKLFQGSNLIGSVIVYIIIVVAEHPF